MCAVHRDEIPTITCGGCVCAVSAEKTCENVEIFSILFAVNPSFSCKVVVSTLRSGVVEGARAVSPNIYDIRTRGNGDTSVPKAGLQRNAKSGKLIHRKIIALNDTK